MTLWSQNAARGEKTWTRAALETGTPVQSE